ncbi:hypothetical protein E2C01_024773 [Portunus trituberculatus]|uniref:HTH psq-type domain-containing protein n=1 Tax=Portunus trituberculatus TaxID=210409 RepID=A0A5B7EER3_PORTR|nr:hypothetical protein [Portunus trituberculatus]
MSPSVAKKTRKSLTLEVKLDIIHRHEKGEKTNSIARHHLDSIYSLLFSSQQALLRRLVPVEYVGKVKAYVNSLIAEDYIRRNQPNILLYSEDEL